MVTKRKTETTGKAAASAAAKVLRLSRREIQRAYDTWNESDAADDAGFMDSFFAGARFVQSLAKKAAASALTQREK